MGKHRTQDSLQLGRMILAVKEFEGCNHSRVADQLLWIRDCLETILSKNINVETLINILQLQHELSNNKSISRRESYFVDIDDQIKCFSLNNHEKFEAARNRHMAMIRADELEARKREEKRLKEIAEEQLNKERIAEQNKLEAINVLNEERRIFEARRNAYRKSLTSVSGKELEALVNEIPSARIRPHTMEESELLDEYLDRNPDSEFFVAFIRGGGHAGNGFAVHSVVGPFRGGDS